MTASELKLGNYVSWMFEDDYYTVIEILDTEDYLINTQKGKETLKGRPDQMQGLLITEDWLISLGFIKRTKTLNELNFSDFRKGNMVCNLIKEGIDVEYCSSWQPIDERTHIATLIFVHQLQNLYFALTGQELVTAEKK